MKKQQDINIARERIAILFEKAEKTEDLSLKNRYVTLARKIAMSYNLKIPKHLKRKFCKYCYKFLVPGKNVATKTKNKKLVVKCLNCGKITRYKVKK